MQARFPVLLFFPRAQRMISVVKVTFSGEPTPSSCMTVLVLKLWLTCSLAVAGKCCNIRQLLSYPQDERTAPWLRFQTVPEILQDAERLHSTDKNKTQTVNRAASKTLY